MLTKGTNSKDHCASNPFSLKPLESGIFYVIEIRVPHTLEQEKTLCVLKKNDGKSDQNYLIL